jgi:hypothetical protein
LNIEEILLVHLTLEIVNEKVDGATSYILKPFDFNAVLKVITDILAK